jgi:plasmid stability protein
MKNMTITVDEDVLLWAEVWAARHDSSVSRLVGEILRERMREEEGYGEAMALVFAQPTERLKESGAYPKREALYDRHCG